jgi:hypothetical protein
MVSLFSSGRVSWINPAQVLSRAAKLLRKCFLPLAGLTLAGHIPSLLADLWAIDFAGADALGGIAALMAGAAAAMVMVRSSRKEDLKVSACVNSVLSWKLVFLASAGLLLFIPLVSLSVWLINWLSLGLVKLAAPLVVLLLFSRLAVIFSMAVPACVLENLGVLTSLKVSRALVKGNYLTILAVWFMTAAIWLIIAAAAAAVLYLVVDDFRLPASGWLRLLTPQVWKFLDKFMDFNERGLNLVLAVSAGKFLFMFLASLINGSIFSELLINRSAKEIKSAA